MSRLGNVLLVLGLVCLVALLAAQSVLGQWYTGFYVLLVVSFLLFMGAVAKDHRFYKEILTMRTTQHGMNMGALILIVAVALAAINFLAVRHSIKWDLTEEKLFSLSDQSIKVAKKIDKPTKFLFFYRMNDQSHMQSKAQVKELVGRYQDQSSEIKLEDIDQLKQPDLAEAYEVTKSVEPVLIITVGDRKTRVENISEQGITNALIKVTRDNKKKIYSLTGHGERDLASSDPNGASDLKKALEESSYEVLPLNLVEKQEIPSDADLVLILGPERSIMEGEIAVLGKYLQRGGRMFIAFDPDMQAPLLIDFVKKLGIGYQKNYVLDQASQLLGASPALALGRKYSGESEITKDFKGSNSMTLFNLATALTKEDPLPPGVKVEAVVMTGETSVTTAALPRGGKVQVLSNGPHDIVLSSTGQWPSPQSGDNNGEAKPEQDYSVVVAGDSDFLTNQWLFQYFNRDLILNTISFLAKDEDLISVRPKEGKTSTLDFPRGRAIAYSLMYLALPLLMFVAAGVVWFRRRGA